jgi:citrate synthase
VDVLQGVVPLLAAADPDLSDDSREANERKAARLIARTASVVAAWHRIRNGRDLPAPDPKLSHAANFLWQMSGSRPDDDIATDLDTCLVLHADHSFLMWTSTARRSTT